MDTSSIRLLTLDVLEQNGSVIFLRKVKDGVANSSYGIHVAKMAGIPASVIKDAKNFQNKHFADYSMNQTSLFTSENKADNNNTKALASLDLEDQLLHADLDHITPMQAMILLSTLKEKAIELDAN